MTQTKKRGQYPEANDTPIEGPSIVLISDLHLTPEAPHILSQFSAFIDSLQHVNSLYILGDLFEYWLGDDASKSLVHLPVEHILQTLTTDGTDVYLIPGNRDFLIGHDFASRTGVTILNDGAVHRLFESHVLLLHGDSLCIDDTEHQQFRSITNETGWRSRFLKKTILQRESIAQSIRFRSNVEKRYKSSEIMDVNQQAVETAIESTPAKLMIHGHTHRPGIHHWSSENKRYLRVVLGDWSEGPSWIEFSKSNLTLHYTNVSERLVYDEI